MSADIVASRRTCTCGYVKFEPAFWENNRKDVFFGNVLLTNIELDQDELYNEILNGKSSDLVNVLTIQV